MKIEKKFDRQAELKKISDYMKQTYIKEKISEIEETKKKLKQLERDIESFS